MFLRQQEWSGREGEEGRDMAFEFDGRYKWSLILSTVKKESQNIWCVSEIGGGVKERECS